jgi:FAD/FMN-containing dehydrogenase/Fe-S oxidoreductase
MVSVTKNKNTKLKKATSPAEETTTGNGMDLHYRTKQSAEVNVSLLEQDLKKVVKGEVRFDDGSRALYATDASNYRQVPIGVVIPRSEEDIINTITLCHRHHAPLLSRGGGTSLAGQCCNVAVVMDMSKYYNNVLHLDKEKKLVTVQPGIVLDAMRNYTDREGGLTFGPDPATHNHCTLGGMLGNNSCGVHSVMAEFYGYGARTSDNTERLTIVTYDGVKMNVGPTSPELYEQIVREGGRKAGIYKKLKAFTDKYADLIRQKFPKIPRRVSGYNLPDLLPENGFNIARALVGSESTCVTIVEATLKLVTSPKSRSLLVLGYPDISTAGHDVMEILKFKPIGLEGIDDLLIRYMKRMHLNEKYVPLLPDGNGWLMVEFGGDSKEDADRQAKQLMDELKQRENAPSMKLFDDPEEEHHLWIIRESGLGATAWVPGEPMSLPGWEDSAVDPKNVGEYLKELRELFDKYDYHPSIYGHFGQGCVHCSVEFDLFTKEGMEKYKRFTVEAAHLVVKYGGSISGEHGDGQSRGDLLEIMYGKEIVQAFREFKAIWDPEGKMNPGKIVDTYGQLSNLRLDNHYNPPALQTHFTYAADNHDFAQSTIRCVGVGQCRREEGGTMCPSYMVTREEAHSTRGRAHMLFEMLQNNPLKNRWKNEAVKESLDLCLSCKGCKSDCPVNVDMATYKSEFLSHYYEGKLRPRSAYMFGWIHRWAKIASLFPALANFMMHTPIISGIVKAVAGIAPQRKMPKFAAITFREWFEDRQRRHRVDESKPRVILWADTFNNFFLPETLVAGTEVLEAAGFEVVIPKQVLCCGRPLYDYGMLTTAKRMLTDILTSLQADIENDTPIVGLEPSCVAVFRDEMVNLLPHHQDALRLHKNVFTLGEFLIAKAPGFKIPELPAKAVVHGHCHHKAIMKMDQDKELLKRSGLDFKVLDSGCCGLAGGFGYEKGDHYDVSIKAGERVLLPAVRNAGEHTLVIADGFSCREQIEQETPRQGLHTAQVLQAALKDRTLFSEPYPEKQYKKMYAIRDKNKTVKTVAMVLAFGAGLFAALAIRGRIKH